MLQKRELDQLLHFVSRRWAEIASDPESRVTESLPDTFWMNSVGGKAGRGRWVTMLMYTESQEDADAFKEVLLRWQRKGRQKGPDLIQIGSSQAADQHSGGVDQPEGFR